MDETRSATGVRSPTNTYRFNGRRAVVTGGSQGLGRAIAERLLGGDASVEVWDLEEPTFPGTGFRSVDVSDWKSVAAAAGSAGAVDILVCSAGIAGPNATTWD